MYKPLLDTMVKNMAAEHGDFITGEAVAGGDGFRFAPSWSEFLEWRKVKALEEIAEVFGMRLP